MDIVEVSPPYDCADITAILANRVALEVLSAIAHKKNNEKNKSSEPYNPKRNLLDR
jgi:agmatinase